MEPRTNVTTKPNQRTKTEQPQGRTRTGSSRREQVERLVFAAAARRQRQTRKLDRIVQRERHRSGFGRTGRERTVKCKIVNHTLPRNRDSIRRIAMSNTHNKKIQHTDGREFLSRRICKQNVEQRDM